MNRRPTPEYLATLTENTQRYLAELEVQVERLIESREEWKTNFEAKAKRVEALRAEVERLTAADEIREAAYQAEIEARAKAEAEVENLRTARDQAVDDHLRVRDECFAWMAAANEAKAEVERLRREYSELAHAAWYSPPDEELTATHAETLAEMERDAARLRAAEEEAEKLRIENARLDAALKAKFRIRTTNPLMNGLVAIGCDEGTLLATIFHLMGELEAAKAAEDGDSDG